MKAGGACVMRSTEKKEEGLLWGTGVKGGHGARQVW